MDAIRFTPLYKPRVWGAQRIAEAFGRQLPSGKIGESWELVDRQEDQSVVAEGKYKGLTLDQLCKEHGAEVLCKNWEPGRRFPIIVKWLDCNERLSLQVHPRPAQTPTPGGPEPKTECWYVKKADAKAGIFVGLKKGTTKEDFVKALAPKEAFEIEKLLHRIPTQEGDFMLLPSGRLHAIDAGNLILEIQQNSDTTYRVYDWGRPRELHLKEGLEAADFFDFEPQSTPKTPEREKTLAQNAFFQIRRLRIKKGEWLELPAHEQAAILSVIEGAFDGVKAGENLLIPRGKAFSMVALLDCVLIITSDFL